METTIANDFIIYNHWKTVYRGNPKVWHDHIILYIGNTTNQNLIIIINRMINRWQKYVYYYSAPCCLLLLYTLLLYYYSIPYCFIATVHPVVIATVHPVVLLLQYTLEKLHEENVDMDGFQQFKVKGND